MLNWNNLDLDKINFTSIKRIAYGKTMNIITIMVDNLNMPFGINEGTKIKTNIKFKINNDKNFVKFLTDLDEKAKSLLPNLDYKPLLKKFNKDDFFLATIVKRNKVKMIDYSIEYGEEGEDGEEEVSETEFLRNSLATDAKIRAFFDLKYLWTENNCYGLTLIVTDLTVHN